MIRPVILAGGSGTRLWPLSRESYPKQFHQLTSEHSLFQETLLRLKGLIEHKSAIVIAKEEHRFIIAEQLRQIDALDSEILLEPCPKGTAPAVALAAYLAMMSNENDLLLVLSSDHAIGDLAQFKDAIEHGIHAANNSKLVVFGIEPKSPETGYGYILKGEPDRITSSVFSVKQFVEKPNVEKAQAYCDSGDYLWNSGIFLFKAGSFLEELKLHEPNILNACQKAMKGLTKDGHFLRPDVAYFKDCPSNSIDYSVMEKTTSAMVVPFNGHWSDIGSWKSLLQYHQTKAFRDHNNHLNDDSSTVGVISKGDVISKSCQNSYFQSEDRLLVTLGLKDTVVVETKDAVLVMDKSYSENIKEIISVLKDKNRKELTEHLKIFRPWGAFETVDCGERYQVKRISVNVGARLSLQLHHHRSEHWVVVQGTAKVTCGDKTFVLSENQSTYIPIGTPHRLENVGKIPLEMIEVQSGSYLGEDDIVRLEDVYGRAEQLSK